MNRQFRALAAHFFGRFFDVDSTSADADSRTRVIQFLALLSVPGLMISFFLMADHPAGSMFIRGAFTEADRLWLRVGDHYVFVAYAVVVMGLLMTFKWESLFPDRRDYLILTSLPISSRRWFAAKVFALGAFLCLFVIAINLFSLLLMPSLLAEQSKVQPPTAFWQALTAHAAGTIGGSIFAALFFAALQGVLINVLTPSAFRRISPRVQMISIAVLVTLLLVIPLVKDSIPALAQNESPLLDYFPLMWFLGVYDALLPGATLIPQSIVWARTGMCATALMAVVFAISYFIGYRRYSRKVLESVESDTVVMRWWKKAADGVVDRAFLSDSIQRGAFHFIGMISTRSTKHRILTALYTGIGLALAVSSLFVVYRGAFRISTMGALEAPLILCFVVISGLRATFNVPAELNANWMFQVTGDGNSSRFLAAIRKWVFLYRIVPLFGLLAIFEFKYFTASVAVLGLAYRSLTLVDSLDIGFNKSNLLLVTVNPTLNITNRDANLAFLEHARERLRTVPGVQAVSYVRLPPPYSVERRRIGGGAEKPIIASVNYVGADYLRALGLKPVLGREFSPDEPLRGRKTALVNQDLAQVLWPGKSALGQIIPLNGGKDSAEVVGVTPDALFSARKEPYFVFLSEQQDRTRVTGQSGLFDSGETTFYVRYAADLGAVGPAIRSAVRDVDEQVPIVFMRTIQNQLDGGQDDARSLTAFLSLFSGGSLLIAAMGQYAVIAFDMKRRTREFGIRVAMGASAPQIQGSVLKEGLTVTAIGLAIGFGMSLTAGFALRGFLTGVTPTDLRTYLGVFLMLAVVSLLACYLPARRASRIDPLITLRYE